MEFETFQKIIKEFPKRPKITIIFGIAIIFISLLSMWLAGYLGEKGRKVASFNPKDLETKQKKESSKQEGNSLLGAAEDGNIEDVKALLNQGI